MEPVPRPGVTPADQERTIGALQAAVGQGLITLDEFSARTDRVLAAADAAELAIVIADLPRVVTRAARADEPLRICTVGTKMGRHGRWTVPSRIVIEASHTKVTLDFREARFVHPIVTIELDVAHSTVLLVLPPAAGVDADAVRPHHSKLPESADPADGGPILVLRGEIAHGRLKVRPRRR
jgi:hypothetical protein